MGAFRKLGASGEVESLPLGRFDNYAARIGADVWTRPYPEVGEALEKSYMSLVCAAFGSTVASAKMHEIESFFATLSGAYNLVILPPRSVGSTGQHGAMLLVPRRREICSAKVSLNALAFCGMFFTRSNAEFERLAAGGLVRALEDCGRCGGDERLT